MPWHITCDMTVHTSRETSRSKHTAHTPPHCTIFYKPAQYGLRECTSHQTSRSKHSTLNGVINRQNKSCMAVVSHQASRSMQTILLYNSMSLHLHCNVISFMPFHSVTVRHSTPRHTHLAEHARQLLLTLLEHITLHCVALYCATLHCIALYYITAHLAEHARQLLFVVPG